MASRYSTVDAILSEDADDVDDVDEGNVNLEDLLLDDDDDDESVGHSLSHRLSVSSQSRPSFDHKSDYRGLLQSDKSNLLDTYLPSRVQNEPDLTHHIQSRIQRSTESKEQDIDEADETPHEAGNTKELLIEPTSADNLSTSDGSFNLNMYHSPTQSDQPSAIDLADGREQRFLAFGNKEIVSILKSTYVRVDVVSGNISIEVMPTLSSQLRKNADYKQHGPGIATVLHSNHRYLAVGTSRGFIILFDYSQEIRQVLGTGAMQSSNASALTALDSMASSAISLLISGNAVGDISLWDVMKGTLLKVVTGIHDSKIMSLTICRPVADSARATLNSKANFVDDQKMNEVMMISIDSKGISHRLKFSKQLWGGYQSETDCLLDGKMGVIQDVKAAKSLREFPFHMIGVLSKQNDVFDITIPYENRLIALSTSTKTFLIQIWPAVRIIHKWSLHVDVGEGSAIKLDWGWSFIRNDTDKKVHLMLYRCYGNIVESLVVKYKAHPSDEVLDSYLCEESHRKALSGVIVVGIRVISDGQIIILTESSCILLNSMFEVIEEFKFPSDLSLAPTKNSSILTSFSSIEQNLYILRQDSIYRVTVEVWTEKLDRLVAQGQWLECLSLIQENYSSLKLHISIEDPSNDIFKAYITEYMQLTMPLSNSIGGSKYAINSLNHFNLVASVCLEICSNLQRFDVLFGFVYDIFVTSCQQSIFLNSLEPFILNRKIVHLPPLIMADFLEFSRKSGKISTLERCLVFLDVERIDMNLMTKFLLENKMYSSFLYVYGCGSMDFGGALQIVCHEISSESSQDAFESLSHWKPKPNQIDTCYKLLLFCKYSVEGLIFPRREKTVLSKASIARLVETMISEKYLPSPIQQKNPNHDHRYPYLSMLSIVDAKALFEYVCKLVGLLETDLRVEDKHLVQEAYHNLHRFSLTFTAETVLFYESLSSLFFSFASVSLSTSQVDLSEDLLIDFVRFTAKSSSSHIEGEKLIIQITCNQIKCNKHLSSYSLFKSALRQNGYFRALLSYGEKQIGDVSDLQDVRDALSFYCSSSSNQYHDKESSQAFEYLEACYSSIGTKDLDPLNGIVVSHISILANINLSQTKALCSRYLLRYFLTISKNLEKSPSKQFEVCHKMVRSVIEDASKSIVDAFRPDDVIHYLSLLAQHQPHQVFGFVTSYDHYPLDEAIIICKNRDILDAASVLIEKTGNISEALDLLLACLSKHIVTMRNEIEDIFKGTYQRKHANEDQTSYRSLIQSILSSRDRSIHIVSKLPYFNVLENCVVHISCLCQRVSSKSTSIDIWFKSFDYVINERKKYSRSVSSTSELLSAIIGCLVQILVSNMKDVVPAHEIVRRVTQSYSGSKYIEFKDIIRIMISSSKHDQGTLSCARNIHLYDYAALLRKKFNQTRRGYAMTSNNEEKSRSMPRQQETVKYSSPVIRRGSTTYSTFEQKKRAFQVTKNSSHAILQLSPPPVIYPDSYEARKPGQLPFEAKYANSYF